MATKHIQVCDRCCIEVEQESKFDCVTLSKVVSSPVHPTEYTQELCKKCYTDLVIWLAKGSGSKIVHTEIPF